MISKQRSKTVLALLSILFIIPLLTGCWDRMEIEERAVVLGIGIDRAEESQLQSHNVISNKMGKQMKEMEAGLVKISVQIAVPGRIPLGPGEGGGGGGGQKSVWVLEAVGYTLADALKVLQQQISGPLFLGHLRIIIVSENVARKGIESVNDYFRRNPEVRRSNWMVICKGEASSIIHASPQLERVPTLYLTTTLDQSVKMGRFPNDFLGVFWSSLSSLGKEGYLPYMELMENDNVQISGLALFKGEKLVSITDPRQIILYMGIMGTREAGGETYVKPGSMDENFLFQSRTRRSITKVTLQNGEPHIKVKTIIEGNLLSKSNESAKVSIAVIHAIEKQLEKKGTKAHQDFIKNTQEVGCDIFGFGEHVRAKLPGYWNKNIQTSEQWREQYRNLHVEVIVDVHIRRIGMKAT